MIASRRIDAGYPSRRVLQAVDLDVPILDEEGFDMLLAGGPDALGS